MNRDIKKILIIVDMVNGFITEGPMSDNYIAHIIPKIAGLAKEYKKEEIIIIKDCHNKNCVEFKTFPEHCLKGTYEAELVKELKPLENNSVVFEKNSTSAMFANGFIEKMNEFTDLEEVTIVGCCTDICVLNLAVPLKNYFNQENRDIKITVPKDMVETYNSDTHNREEYNNIAFKILSMSGIVVM